MAFPENPSKPKKPREFTDRQLKFIELYEGNGTDAARRAGYSGSDNVLGKTAYELLRNPKIVEAIKKRHDEEIRPMIADRAQRQIFWTEIMNDDSKELSHRLKASELLGKSDADFIEKHEHSGPDGKPIETKDVSEVTDDALDERIRSILTKVK